MSHIRVKSAECRKPFIINVAYAIAIFKSNVNSCLSIKRHTV